MARKPHKKALKRRPGPPPVRELSRLARALSAAEARAIVPAPEGDMATELHINFGGTTPGLAEHRLSLLSFGDSLDVLRGTLQRIASELTAEARGTRVREAGREYGKKGGRYAKRAEVLDIQLEQLEDAGSVKLLFLVTLLALTGQKPLWADDLPRRTVERFLEGVQDESEGRPYSHSARKYLASLPGGVERQTYQLLVDGKEQRRVEVGELQVAPIPVDLPVLEEIVGQVVGVGFEPGRSHVRILHARSTTTLHATAEQVEAALALRGREVRALDVTEGEGRRLLRLAAADAPLAVEPREHLFVRWAGLLERLSK
jgi:hypothetical protein